MQTLQPANLWVGQQRARGESRTFCGDGTVPCVHWPVGQREPCAAAERWQRGRRDGRAELLVLFSFSINVSLSS